MRDSSEGAERAAWKRMRPDMGLWDRLFGERVEIQLPGPGGAKRVSVTKRWVEEMVRQGKMSPTDDNFVQVHILDPGGAARAALGLPGPSEDYYVETWRIGEDVPKDMVERFRNPTTQAIYAMTKYEEGRVKKYLVKYELWEAAKQAMDQL